MIVHSVSYIIHTMTNYYIITTMFVYQYHTTYTIHNQMKPIIHNHNYIIFVEDPLRGYIHLAKYYLFI